MKSKFFWMALGSIITILAISICTFLTSYENNVKSMLRITVKYKGETLYTDFSSDICGYLTSGEKRKLYFGELPSQDNSIEINAPRRAVLYVYPSSDDSIIVRYEPQNGIKRTYRISGFGDFNDVLDAFYILTDNEIFYGAEE